MPIRCRGDRAQAVPLALGLVAFAIVVMLALGPLARGTSDRARARAAADAAALAGAAAGEAEAREIAADNGAELTSWWAAGADVWVEVRVGDARAVAKARRS